ncbi:MAG TPA: SusC/RagA family TonB-linked outer membrane protein, partial [Balneolales bacterium]|nr:SusC/RagA family TonB-linked outer membrane protein [Balneolales bacterium]
NAFAQQQIKGKVIDASTGEALPGVNILVLGTTKGTATDTKGNYQLTVTSVNDTLKFSYIGYANKIVPINGRRKINVKLTSKTVNGQQIVVVGYGTEKKEDLTGSVASVSSKDFTKAAPRDAASLIQGKVAGLNISTTSGNPTEGSQISLRGVTTLMGSSTPLVLIDGVPGDLNTVSPENIASISVLKGGSAAAIYGTRGSNGVILITTRQAKSNQKPTIEYDGYVNVQTIYKKPHFLNAADYRKYIKQGYNFTDYGGNTDWLNRIMRTPLSQDHNLSLMGGDPNTSYTASLNYKSWQGIFLNSDNKRLSGRVNVHHSMFDGKLKSTVTALVRDKKYWTGGDGYSFNNYVYRQALIRNPTDTPYDKNGNYIYRSGYRYDNPLVLLNERNGDNENREFRLHGTMQWKPINNLNVKLLASTDKWTQIRGFSESLKDVSNIKLGLHGYASRGTSSKTDQLLEMTGNYQHSFGEHQFKLLGGYSYQNVVNQGFWMNNYHFPTDLFTYNSLGSGNALTQGKANMNSSKSSYKLIGFFSRLNYNFNNKYLLMASMRYEGNSKFGANHKWGMFPALSVGWRISQEKFMKNISFISDLKIRAGYGVTGIAPEQAYQSLTAYSYGAKMYSNGQWIQGLAPSRNPNPNLKWERKAETDIGLDFSLFKDKLSGSFDVYKRDTKDMLWNYSVPVPPYLYNTILANVGHIRNEGIEAQLKYTIARKGSFSWITEATASTNRNKLVSLNNDQFHTTNNYFDTGYTGEPIQLPTHRVQIGGPIGNFYGFKSVDIDNQGRWIILNKNGKRIPIADAHPDDRRVLGNGIPKYHLSWNNTFSYKNWDLNINMHGAFGFQILNLQKMFYSDPKVTQYNMLKSAFNKVYGKHILNDDLAYVSYYIENGDYWKFQTITLGYTFNVNKISEIQKARIYVSGYNLFTITGYSGMDPEVTTGTGTSGNNPNALAPGVDARDKYPTTRTFTLGINLTF